ncbi:MAG: hypothetical protein KQH79_07300 [Bacteroidetes bacterium]|nr:hypothetical protein [Bacteroidota bacterium]
MRKLFIVLLILCAWIELHAQSPKLKELWKLYRKEKFDELIEKGEVFLENDPDNIEFNFWVGKAYTRKSKIEEAFPYFEKAAMHKDPNSTIKARAQVYIGIYYFFKEKKDKSKEAFLEGQKIKSYSGISEASEFWYERLGFDDFFQDWSQKETEHFIFYFQDTTDLNYKRFINNCEQAYTAIDTFFHVTLPKKIDYYVWTSTTDARNIIKSAGAFAMSDICLIHGNTNENEGHEIAHVISLNSIEDIEKNRFITEGTAVYFDQTNLDIEQWFEGVLDDYDIKKIDVKKVWDNCEKFPANYYYHLGGLFVEALINEYGQDKFLEFFADQSYKNAQAVFGKELDDFIKEFESGFN